MSYPPIGDVISLSGVYQENPQYYEFNVETKHPLPVGELVQIDGDDRVYRVLCSEGTTSRLRLVSKESAENAAAREPDEDGA